MTYAINRPAYCADIPVSVKKADACDKHARSSTVLGEKAAQLSISGQADTCPTRGSQIEVHKNAWHWSATEPARLGNISLKES